METTKITLSQAVQLIYNTKGQLFSAKFYKKNGELRSMVCRLGVTKDLKGGTLKYSPALYDLVPVFEIKGGRKMINLKGLETLKIKGVTYEVFN